MTSGTLRPGAGNAVRLWSLLLAALLPACGGDSSSVVAPPPPSPSPIPVTTVIDEGSFSGLPPQGGAAGTFTTTRTGDLEFVVDWTFASNNLDLLLFRGECSEEQFLAEQCNLADSADSTTAKPERVGIGSAAAGTYTLVVINLGETEESFSYQVLLTTVGSASEPGVRSSWRAVARKALPRP
jgi:hypothetical protein